MYTEVRDSAVEALGQVDLAEPTVVAALVAARMDYDLTVRCHAAEALGKLGQKRSDWTDEKMLELLQDNDSGQRELAGIVLAYREKLSSAVIEQIRKLRKDHRPWVRMAALYALARIEEVRFQREQEANAKPASTEKTAP